MHFVDLNCIQLSRPDHRELFILYVGWGVIVTCVGHLGEFVILWWPDMVPNQRQLFIVVSDWGSYLGSHFPHCDLWDLVYS